MAEQDDQREIERLYRELPREEPPPHLDEAIRAQARRAGATRPAPLVPPTGRRSWHYPVAAAAVVVLAVAVTWHVEREDPDLVANGTVAEAGRKEKVEAKEEQAPAVGAKREGRRDAAKQEGRRDAAPRRQGRAPKPVDQAPAAPPPPPAAEAPAAAPAAPSAAREAAPARDAAGPLMSQRQIPESLEKRSMARAEVAETPEQWLERIAKLRREGRHEEADKALAEFRKRYPDFAIPPAMLEQVEKK